jgi:DNA-binding GntR family transcriptional regulator
MTPEHVGLTRSVPQAIEGILRDRILGGDLKPDAPLRESALAIEFEVSRHTVREALLLLERAGLIKRRNHRGSRVTVPDLAHLREVMAFRRVVEPGAIRQIGGRPELFDDLRQLAKRLEQSAEAGDWSLYVECDLQFHTGLVRAGGGDRLAREFGRVIEELRLHFNRLDHQEPPALAEVQEHRALVNAIVAGRELEALKLVDSHLEKAEATLVGGVTGTAGSLNESSGSSNRFGARAS